jgi:DNA-binding NarL/FixJ family response regulator
MGKKRVLVVDDNQTVRSMVRQLFESEPNYEIAGEAENGREAVTKAKTLNPDLIILDLSMPVMSGIEAAPFLRKASPMTRLILFTVQQGRELERLAFAAGIDAVVSKDQGASRLIPQAQTVLSDLRTAKSTNAAL